MVPQLKQIRGPSSRSKAACQYCRDRHVKCDQLRPCRACTRLDIPCDGGDNILFDALEWLPRRHSYDTSPQPTSRTNPHATIHVFIDETSSVAGNYTVVGTSSRGPPSPLSRQFATSSSVAAAETSTHHHRLGKNDLLDAASIGSISGKAVDPLPAVRPAHPLPNDPSQSTDRQIIAPGAPLTNPTEAYFFGRYADIIGTWFDLFDEGTHFSSVVPQLALSDRLLLIACIAASSRQHALVTSHGRSDSLSYYNQAIRMLYERLGEQGEPDPSTFASCLLIAYCEMLESQAADWNLHLRGVREIVTMQGWNGISGGLGQACFWVYCRMVILSCLSSSTSTPIPTSTWVPASPAMSPTASNLPNYVFSNWTLPAWANKTVHFLGQINNFLVSSRRTLAADGSPATLAEIINRWETLRARLDRHNAERPSICQPLSILSRSPTDDAPFLSVRYINGSVAAARQTFHTAILLMHLSKPSLPSSKLASLSIPEVVEPSLKAARKIVANSMANRSTTSWVNAVQLLTTAGMCLAEWRERKACLAALEDIQRVTGWVTGGNMTELINCWGWQNLPGGWKAVDGNVRVEKIGELLFNAWRGITTSAERGDVGRV